MLKALKKYIPFKQSPFGYFIYFLQFFYLYQVFASNDTGGLSFSTQSILMVIVSMFTVWLWFYILTLLGSIHRLLVALLNGLGLTMFGIITGYHFGTHDLLDYSVIIDNASTIFTPEAYTVIFNTLDTGALYYVIAFCLLWVYFEYKKKAMSKAIPSKKRKEKCLIAIGVYIVFLFIPINSVDPQLNFFKTAIQYYTNNSKLKSIQLPPDTFPFERTFNQNYVQMKPKKKPDIFLVIIESFNHSILNKKNLQQEEITPYFNKLMNESVYIDQFYGNSIQTAKGHFATFFSTIPSIIGKTYTKYKQVNIKSIASVLKENGYETYYINAHKTSNFDNTESFVSKRGFDHFININNHLTDSEKDHLVNTWGPEDSVFYQAAFRYLRTIDSKKPKLIVLATIFNHFPFNTIPTEKQFCFKPPQNIKERYANSMHLSDIGINRFFWEIKDHKQYKDALIIITGDHAYPLGEHGNYHLEAGFHEESYRIPFFLVWNKLKPQKLPISASQIDIAPTLLDLLNIKAKKIQFEGQSIFKKKNRNPIPEIQPYAKQIGIIDYPIKYRFNMSLQKGYAYHLKKDPLETKNILNTLSKKQIERFDNRLNQIYLNQKAIQNNQLLSK